MGKRPMQLNTLQNSLGISKNMLYRFSNVIF